MTQFWFWGEPALELCHFCIFCHWRLSCFLTKYVCFASNMYIMQACHYITVDSNAISQKWQISNCILRESVISQSSENAIEMNENANRKLSPGITDLLDVNLDAWSILTEINKLWSLQCLWFSTGAPQKRKAVLSTWLFGVCLAQKNELSNIQISSEGYLSECQW